GAEVRRYQNDLYLMRPLPPVETAQRIPWDGMHELEIAGWRLRARLSALGLSSATEAITVRFRQGGEKIHLPGRGRHLLKKLFQEWQVPPWERDRLPLIFAGEQLIAVAGYAIDKDYF